MKSSLGFRSWFYFRMGWSTYFAFVLGAVNTLTVTYYLAIEKVPALVAIFPTFIHYVVILVSIGVPILIIIGYIHYKRTLAYKSETDVVAEANPYNRRNIVNNTITAEISIKNLELLLKLARNESITEDDLTYRRPGHGIQPDNLDKVLGKKLKYEKNSEEMLTLEDLTD